MKIAKIIFGLALFSVLALGLAAIAFNGVEAQSRGKGAGAASAGGTLKVLVSRNGPDNAGEVGIFAPGLKSKLGMVKVGFNEGIAIDKQGDLYQCGDGAGGPGIRIFARFAQRSNKVDVAFDANRDREIKGAKTTLKNPKGIDLDNTRGLIIVAENGNSTILVFSAEAAGDVAPLGSVKTEAKPWDVEYDEATDTLYVALVNGKVNVYDQFVFGGYNATPARVITPEGSVNLHGIIYDRAKDLLLLSDVGDAKSNEDGKLFVIKTASKANGTVKPARTIEGAATKLGNPVDIIWDGSNLYVAEKANDLLLVYRNFAVGQSGSIAADLSVADAKPEALIFLND